MRFQHVFDVGTPRERVWEFFENHPDDVAACVDGAFDFEVLEDDRYRLKISQQVGAFKATFDMRAAITDREGPERIRLTSHGRSIKGVRGDLRATADILLGEDDGRTVVRVESDVVLGGPLGSLGHKVIQVRAEELVASFAAALADRLSADLGAETEISALRATNIDVSADGVGTRIQRWWRTMVGKFRQWVGRSGNT